MKKINKAVATMMAVTVAMNAMMVPAMAEEKYVPTEDGTYKTIAVDVYNSDNLSAYSSSNGIFADAAEVTISGDMATVVVYVCNPLPKYAGVEGGLFTNNSIAYGDETYVGTITSVGYNNENAIVKKYTTGIANYGVIAGESYTSDAIEFTLPKEALEEKMPMTGTIYLDMGGMIYNRKHVYVLDLVFEAPEVTSQGMEVTATIPANVATYAVSIPETTALGELSTVEDTTVDYTVEVDTDFADKTITVETTDVVLTDANGEVSLTITNEFGENGVEVFAESGSATGTLTAAVGDVIAAATDDAQNLSGSIIFTITAQ